MPEESVDKNVEGLKKDIKSKEDKSVNDVIKQIATRDKLERDYKEDLLKVIFRTSPETFRTLEARRPTQDEMLSIMRLSTEATIYEGRADTKSVERLLSVYEQLPKIAAKLSVDNTLNEEFWKTKISFYALQNFITELIRISQMGPVTEEEMKSFRQ